MSSREAGIAVHRFGYGARPGELDAAASDPKGWLLGQLERNELPDALEGLPSMEEVYRVRGDYFLQRRQFVRERQAAIARGANPDRMRKEIEEAGRWMQTALGVLYRQALLLEWAHGFNATVASDVPFRERLVHFWSNHLVVPNAGGKTLLYLGAYEREVIRPHVTGKFVDMLMASVKHPAMLIFLDNNVSVGPNSPEGRAKGESINENLAREIMELHTLGVDGGYTQGDVIELAKGISGWGVVDVPGLSDTYTKVPFPDIGLPPGTFHFYAERHEPPPATLLRKTYGGGGPRAGRGDARGSGPSPRHGPLPRDEARPSFRGRRAARGNREAARRRLSPVGHRSRGNDALSRRERGGLAALHQASSAGGLCPLGARRVLSAPIAGGRVPSPVARMDLLEWNWRAMSYALAYDRAEVTRDGVAKQLGGRLPDEMDRGFQVVEAYKIVQEMGQPPMAAPGPQGWYDRQSDWSGADSIMKRIEFGVRMGTEHADRHDARELARATLGGLPTTI
ncbi:MAG: DUF1800 family protein [Alphaproteobacteria bacterium]|nr:DUF1800 family protein [Alphaproteobacteria bacterium]